MKDYIEWIFGGIGTAIFTFVFGYIIKSNKGKSDVSTNQNASDKSINTSIVNSDNASIDIRNK